MAGTFDDLIPSGGGTFDDLVPKPPDQQTWGDRWSAVGNRLSDLGRVAVDTASRGFADKLAGGDQQQLTQEARQRLGWNALPADIGAAVVSAPYRLGSTLYAAGAGGAEGIASAYGHSKNWVPSWDDLRNMAWEGTKGAATGAAFGAAGDLYGKYKGMQQAIKSSQAADDAFRTAAQQSGTAQAAGQVEKLDALRSAQSQPRDQFAQSMVDASNRFRNTGNYTPAETAAIKATQGTTALQRAAQNPIINKLAWSGGADHPLVTVAADAMLNKLALGVPTLVRGAATGIKHFGSKAGTAPPQQIENIASIVRDPASGGLKTDQATVDRLRDEFARMGIAAYRSF